jgi:hypothetical protein
LSHWSLDWTLGTKSCLVFNKLSIFSSYGSLCYWVFFPWSIPHNNLPNHNVVSSSNAKTISMNFINLEHEPKLPNIVVNKWKYEPRKKIYDTWATWLPWAKTMVDGYGLMTSMRWKIYFKIKGKFLLLIPKLDYLLKHVGRRKTIFVMLGVKNWFVLSQQVCTCQTWSFVCPNPP